ncbi:MAG: serine/threonine protein kinase [Bacteroides sp.]|nr:serine/threonine protein kinase [Bacteroides sp.]
MDTSKALKPDEVLKGPAHTYRIVKVLGSGSFGITYLADVVLGGKIASAVSMKVTIKEFFMKSINGRDGSVVTTGSEDGYFSKYLDKFVREADKLASVESTAVVNVLESFRANNTAYYVMQYLPGGSLNDLISLKGKLPESVALHFACELAAAVRDLHSQKMLHLDLKPSNVMLSADYDAVLIDFGLAKQYGADGEPESSTDIGAGTRGYAPIEQAHYRDSHDFPATMDIYAFGATLFKMLCGSVPPDSSAILNDGFPEHQLKQAGVSPVVINFVKKLMAPMKKERPQTMDKVLSELKAIGAKRHIADKKEAVQWIGVTTDSEEDTDVEIVGVEDTSDINSDINSDWKWGGKGKSHETEPDLGSGVDKIELLVISDTSNPYRYTWVKVTATSENLNVIYQKKGEQFAEKENYQYTPEKFRSLKDEIAACGISAESNPSLPWEYDGVQLKTYRSDALLFDASTFEDGEAAFMTGNVEKLKNIVWKESGLSNLSIWDSNKGILEFFRRIYNEHSWILYAVITAVITIAYLFFDPIEPVISKSCRNDVVYWDNTSVRDRFQFGRRVADSPWDTQTWGIEYTRTGKWVVPPHYNKSNPNERFAIGDTAIMNPTYIIAQLNDFGLVAVPDSIYRFKGRLFLKDRLVEEIPHIDYGDITKIHKKLYRIHAEETNVAEGGKNLYAIYDTSGNVVLPFSFTYKQMLSDNIIKVTEPGSTDSSYYDLEGKPIQGFNFIVLYDRFGSWINLLAIAFLSFIACILAKYILTRRTLSKAND